MSIGEKLKALRMKRNLSQNELSVLSGVSRITISKLETGKQDITTNKTLQSLGSALGVKASYFFY